MTGLRRTIGLFYNCGQEETVQFSISVPPFSGKSDKDNQDFLYLDISLEAA